VVKVLLGAGADVNETNSDGETPLSLVIRLKQKKELIELLREKTNGAMGIRKNTKSKKTKKKRKNGNKKRKSRMRK
jgi:ankyrin repeat protein